MDCSSGNARSLWERLEIEAARLFVFKASRISGSRRLGVDELGAKGLCAAVLKGRHSLGSFRVSYGGYEDSTGVVQKITDLSCSCNPEPEILNSKV